MPNTLIHIFLDAVVQYHKPAQFMRKGAAGWESISAGRALADVESLALGLADLGVRAGDRVALLSESRYEWPVTDLAVLGLGAVVVPIYPTLTAAQCRHVLGDSEACALIVSDETQLAKALEIRASLPSLKTLVVMDAVPALGTNVLAFASVLARGAERRAADPTAFRAHAHAVRPDDLATIIYTSGTTGEPKGAMLTHGNIAFDVEASLRVVTLRPDDVSLSFLPLCHVFERMGGLYAMLKAGVTIAYAENMQTVPVDIREVRPTVITGVPRLYEKVHERALERVRTVSPLQQRLFAWGLAQGVTRARAHFDGREVNTLAARLADALVGRKVRAGLGGRLRMCISGGAALSPRTMEFFFAVGIPVVEGYGLTETSPVICLNPPGRERPGSVGPAIPGVEVSIGTEGEILTRGQHVMRGYYRNEQATREVLKDGWFHTGDVGRLDANGYLYITDRLKDLLVLAGGKKVAPQPIESKLKQSPLVAEAVMLGDRRPYAVCLIAPAFGPLEDMAKARGWSFPSREELVARPEVRALYQAEIDRVNAELAKFETIKSFTVLGDELTLENGAITPTLKVKRRVVADRYASIIEGLYAGHTVSGAA